MGRRKCQRGIRKGGRFFARFSAQGTGLTTDLDFPSDFAYLFSFHPRSDAQSEEPGMARAVATQLMFGGTAEEAMDFYVSLFPGSEVKHIERYGPGEQGAEGSLKRVEFTLGGHRLSCIDSPVKHGFTFTPSISLFVECADEA